MKVTPAMMRAAQRAELDFYQKGRSIGARFVPTPLIRAMLNAALATIQATPEAAEPASWIVDASRPKRR
jgi:hypothetical protein